MRLIALVLFLTSVFSVSLAQQTGQQRRDSLIARGVSYRLDGQYVEALNCFGQVGGERGDVEKALTCFLMGRFRDASVLAKDVIGRNGLCVGDAKLVLARVRDAQDFERIAALRYRKIYSNPDYSSALRADAAFYAAAMYYRKGRASDALSALQKSLQFEPSMVIAWQTMAQILVNRGERYRAVLTLFKLLRVSPSDESVPSTVESLKKLLSPAANTIAILGSLSDGDRFLNRIVDHKCETDEDLAEYTKQIRTFLETEESALDWWQVHCAMQ